MQFIGDESSENLTHHITVAATLAVELYCSCGRNDPKEEEEQKPSSHSVLP